MAEDNATRKPNGVMTVEGAGYDSEEQKQELTLYTILNRLIAAIFFPGPNSSASLLQRMKACLSDNIPLLRDASRNTARHVLLWTRRGSPLRALLVVSNLDGTVVSMSLSSSSTLNLTQSNDQSFLHPTSRFMVGTIVSLTLAGLLVFLLFFVAATVNAVVISLVMSLAAAGGFLALFFACVAAIYVGALSVAVFVISTATISCIVAVLIATGWIGFFWTLWLAAQKSIFLAKHCFFMTGSALSAYSTAWHARRNHVSKKSD